MERVRTFRIIDLCGNATFRHEEGEFDIA